MAVAVNHHPNNPTLPYPRLLHVLCSVYLLLVKNKHLPFVLYPRVYLVIAWVFAHAASSMTRPVRVLSENFSSARNRFPTLRERCAQIPATCKKYTFRCFCTQEASLPRCHTRSTHIRGYIHKHPISEVPFARCRSCDGTYRGSAWHPW